MIENKGQTPKPEEQKPIKVRGHHVETAKSLLIGEISAAEMTDASITVSKDIGIDEDRRIDYTKDFLGSTPQDEQKARNKLNTFYKNLEDLHPNDPIEIVAAKKDGMCNSCSIGEHCSDGPEDYKDVEYIKTFVDKATNKGIPPEDLKIKYKDSEPVSITLPKEQVASIIKDVTDKEHVGVFLRSHLNYYRKNE